MSPDEIDRLATRFFTAIEQGDLDAAGALYRDDVVVWHNYDGIEQGKAINLAVLGWMAANTTRRCYARIQRVVTDDGFVQQHVLTGVNRLGGEFEVPAMMRVWVTDGLIVRLDEYLDSAHIPRVVGNG